MRSWKLEPWAVVDVETTGLSASNSRITELAIVRFELGIPVKRYSVLFDPECALSPEITRITGLRDEDLRGRKPFRDYASLIGGILGRAPHISAYNAPFDRSFVNTELLRVGQPALREDTWLDALPWIWEFDKYERGKKLTEAAGRRRITVDGHAHRAAADAEMAGKLLWHLVPRLPDDCDEMIGEQERLRELQQREREARRSTRQ